MIMMGKDAAITYTVRVEPRVPQWQKDVPPEDVPFIKTIIERPDEDAPRLVYADHLEERGNPWAEVIRLQIKWFPVTSVAHCPMNVRGRLCQCKRCNKAREFRRDSRRVETLRMLIGISDWKGYERGFVSYVDGCTVGEWHDKGPIVMDRHPLIRFVFLIDLWRTPVPPEWNVPPLHEQNRRVNQVMTCEAALKWAKAEAEKLPS